MLFVSLIIPVALMHITAWLLVILCEIGWIIIGYVSGRTEHEWLQWTERLLDWMQELGDRVKALNSPPNVSPATGHQVEARISGTARRGPLRAATGSLPKPEKHEHR